jgi:hypothetical protein
MEGIPLHKERGTSFHFHPHFMGKCVLHGKECNTLESNVLSLLRGCNILYNMQILTQGNQAWCFMFLQCLLAAAGNVVVVIYTVILAPILLHSY